MALSLTGVAGLAGLGTEAANWYLTHRAMQGATDAAAHSAATAITNGATGSTAIQAAAKAVAASYGFGSNLVTVNNPPASGSHNGDSNYVEAVISQAQAGMFSALFMSSPPTISSRSVAQGNANLTNPACVLALDKNSETSLSNNGTTSMTFNGCALYVNSKGPAAANLQGTVSISASAAYVAGSVSGSGLTTTNGTYTGVDPIKDPYAGVAVPTKAACDKTSNYHLNSGDSATLTPASGSGGIYKFCNDVTLNGQSTLNLCPGTYIFEGSNTLNINAGATLNAPPTANTTPTYASAGCTTTGGVTIVLKSGSSGGNPYQISTGGSATLNLTAPTTGSTAGIAIFQDRVTCSGNGNSGNGCANSLTGGGTQNIQGAIYLPNNELDVGGGASSGSLQASCTQLVAYKVQFSGTSNFSSNCTTAGTKTLAITASQLVE